jgi:hypothetical protein
MKPSKKTGTAVAITTHTMRVEKQPAVKKDTAKTAMRITTRDIRGRK